ncbi:TPA: hypothetical protein PXP39_002997 [Yersinia enterocolitica]|nr:hypothetical protein [Yersinia enterocolitica]HDL7833096.1 hypothetical protein [Yersinia enterocolitica]HDL7873303.1 hypothetical protein [Yersinia enterocolitica]HDL7887398.1 hypothetical protein [Yersinia enterocolitica]HDL7895334.1 hypothetical protein [Yersinia enterocolitica]
MAFQRWLRQYRGESRGNTPLASAITPEQRRIQELEKQVRQLQSDNDLLKKASVDSIEQRQKVAVKLKKAGANIQQVCRCLSLTRSVFYARSRRPMIKPDILMLHAAAKHVHTEMDATYGSRRMCIELR